jgi:hypothetical protein
MDNSNSIAPVGAIPAVAPVIQRKPRQQQADNKHDNPSQSKQEPEEKKQTTDENKKAGGLDCYA